MAKWAGLQAADRRDALPTDAHRERLGLETRAPAGRARPGKLILPQEDADVLLVPLRLQAREEREHPEEPAARAVQEEVAVSPREVVPRGIERDAACPRGLPQDAAPALVARLGPPIGGAPRPAPARVRHDGRLCLHPKR